LSAGGSQQYYNVEPEPVWQPQPQYCSVTDPVSSAPRYPPVNGARYADDGYGPDLDSSGHFDGVEPGFTQQQVNGAGLVISVAYLLQFCNQRKEFTFETDVCSVAASQLTFLDFVFTMFLICVQWV